MAGTSRSTSQPKQIRPELSEGETRMILDGLELLHEEAKDIDQMHTITDLMARLQRSAEAFRKHRR